jgi:hypothetical protein
VLLVVLEVVVVVLRVVLEVLAVLELLVRAMLGVLVVTMEHHTQIQQVAEVVPVKQGKMPVVERLLVQGVMVYPLLTRELQ